MNDIEFTIFINALKFSAEKHRHERRKDKLKSAYITHPIQVVEMLWNTGGVRDIDLLTAALLHDVLEDTPTEETEISDPFGQLVLDLVKEVSDNKSLKKGERKRQQVLHAPNLSPKAKLLKLSDKTCNVRDIRENPPNWSITRKLKYIVWSKEVVDKMRGIDGNLEAKFDEAYALTYKSLVTL
jgi:GTP diphosphokinase / guanosine-3',5'-bis(diphosphate) 3'-diphosphatase